MEDKQLENEKEDKNVYEKKININNNSFYIILMIIVAMGIIGITIEDLLSIEKISFGDIVLGGVKILFGFSLVKFAFLMKKSNKNIDDIKPKGNKYEGEVIFVKRIIKYKENIHDKVIVKFFDGNKERYILSHILPQILDLKKENNEDCLEIEFEQYDYLGYSRYEPELDEIEEPTIIKEKVYKNFIGNITCNVYEDNGKYIVDDLIIKKKDLGLEKTFKKLIHIYFIAMIIIIIFVLALAG